MPSPIARRAGCAAVTRRRSTRSLVRGRAVPLPARARRHAGRRLLATSTGWTDAGGAGRAAGRAVPWPRRQLVVALCARADAHARRRSAGAASFRISAAAAASRTACRAPITPATTPRSAAMLAAVRARVAAGDAAVRGRRVAGRQRAAQLARPRQERRAAHSIARGRGGVRAARPDGGRHRRSARASTASTRGISCAR